MNVAQSLTYDYGSSGSRVQSFSVPAILAISLFTLLLALASLLLLPLTGMNALRAVFVFSLGAWMGLVGLHLRRDGHAIRTRYVLTDVGIEVSAEHRSVKIVPWSAISSAHQCRFLRYFRLASSLVSPDIVLIFGAPPKAGINGQIKYARTGAILADKLGDRLTRGWL
jgi:hypothetical protein